VEGATIQGGRRVASFLEAETGVGLSSHPLHHSGGGTYRLTVQPVGPCWSVMASVLAVRFGVTGKRIRFLLGDMRSPNIADCLGGHSVAGVPQLAWVATRTRDPAERAGAVN
jgi:hypothetical protein